MTATVPAPVRLRGNDVDIPPALLNVGGPSLFLGLLFWGLYKGIIVVGKVYDREVERGDKMAEIAGQATKALEGIANSENLAVALLKSVERKAAENDAREGGEGQ